MKRSSLVLSVLAATVGAAAIYTRSSVTPPRWTFRTVVITRGDLCSTISATGTLEPEEVVDVGAQVMGSILEFGQDPRDSTKAIDYGSVVERGTVLARIDPTLYEAALAQAEAALERSKADQDQLEAKFHQLEKDFRRAENLRTKNALAASDYDSALASYLTAKANLAVGKATVRQNDAAVRTARYNLGYTTIKSPVRGVILDRRMNIGQTVVANLNAPSLFLIAKDLRRMQVWASVNEADIGRIRPGMPVRFTVDAHPGESFFGKVVQIRLNATMTQNIVTYTVIVTTDNSSGKLLPYLTANIQFEVDQRSNVLLVPNGALRWKPQASQIDPALRNSASSVSQDRGIVWTRTEGGFVRPLEVVIGASDATMTQVTGSDITDGTAVIVGEQGADSEEISDGEPRKNPFLPAPPKGPPPGPM